MIEKKFNPEKLDKLNNPNRLLDIPPEFVRDRLQLEKRDIFVEIGAGTAFFSIALLEACKPSLIYACDVSEIMIDWIKNNVAPTFPNIIPVKTEEYAVPLDGAIADLVYMINLHHELESPSRTIREAHRILKPSGCIFVIDWKKEQMTEGPPENIRYMPEKVSAQLLESGFVNLSISNELSKHFMVVGKKAYSVMDTDKK